MQVQNTLIIMSLDNDLKYVGRNLTIGIYEMLISM
jgi:hypothetical protein